MPDGSDVWSAFPASLVVVVKASEIAAGVDSSVLLVLKAAVLELVELVVPTAADDDNDHPAALSRSEYCMLSALCHSWQRYLARSLSGVDSMPSRCPRRGLCREPSSAPHRRKADRRSSCRSVCCCRGTVSWCRRVANWGKRGWATYFPTQHQPLPRACWQLGYC